MKEFELRLDNLEVKRLVFRKNENSGFTQLMKTFEVLNPTSQQ